MEQIIAETDSKQVLKGFTPSTTQSVFPSASFDVIMSMVDSDPVARGALTHFVDKCMEGDYCVLYLDPATKEYTYDKSFEILLDNKYMFRTAILRKLYLSLKLFNNAFIEIVRNPSDNTTKSLNVLDPTVIKPVTEFNGDPIKYIERPRSGVAGNIVWQNSEITWVKLNDRTTGFAPTDLESMYRTLLAKSYVTRYVAWLFQTGQYRLAYNFKNSTEKDINDFLGFYEKMAQDFTMPLIAKGDFTTSVLRDMKEVDNLLSLLKYYDSQILVNMRIPPMDAGIPDGSGRSNADASTNNLTTHVTSCKRTVEDYINFDLFPKINKSNSLLRFAPADRFSEEQVFKIAQMMQAMQIKPEVIQEYLFDKGIIFEEEDIFIDPADAMEDTTETGTGSNPRANDMAPSRVDQSGKDTRGMGGVSNVSTREDQIS